MAMAPMLIQYGGTRSPKKGESVTIKDKHHDPDIEHAAPEPQGEGNEVEFQPMHGAPVR
ncbi:hypothetical protein GGI1_20406, partial [Acidithiobacillus sp. GGI-221]